MPDDDLPWNDVPADSDVVPGTLEPDPAEVEGDDGEEVDVSHPPMPDSLRSNRRESLDERLAEEVPDRASQEQDPEAGGVLAPEAGESDITLDRGEPDDDSEDAGDEPAEEAAMHIVEDDRV